MKAFLFAVFLLSSLPALAGEQSIVPAPTPEGGLSIKVVNSNELFRIGPDKGGKRTVHVSFEGKVYEGTVTEVKADEKKKP